jgi:hypothetical protein
MSEVPPVVVKVGRLTDVVSAVPHLLGFRPAESLVAVALRGPRSRMEFTVRLDLPRSATQVDAVVQTVRVAMRRARARAVLLLVYTDELPDGADLPHHALVDAVEDRLSMPLRDAVLVSRERMWSYACDDPGCCPVEGRPVDPASPGTVALGAASALLGRSVLPDRETAVASVQRLGGLTAASMDQAIDRLGCSLDDVDRGAWLTTVRDTWTELLKRYAEPPATVTHDEAAVVIVGLHAVEVRDEVVKQLLGDDDDAHRLLADLARLAPAELDAPVCTVLACAAYLRGSGLIAGAALERALSTDPDYGLAGLLDTALRGQVAPKLLRSALAASGG